MATSTPENPLPIFYNTLQPLSSSAHAGYRTKQAESAEWLAQAHAVPLTIDEFVIAQRHFPIVFSAGEVPVPLALMGLNEGVNVFLDDEGKLRGETYMPAYIRRYPFMLARLRPDAQELSLCFDDSTGLVGKFEEGNPLFTDDGQPSETTNGILKFCEEFEISAQRTQAFMNELQELDLLIEGEVSIQPSNADQPFVYRGFKMVAEDKLRELRGDTLRKMNQNGMLALVMAHIFSLPMIRDIFSKQVQQNKGPYPGTVPFG